MHRIEWNDGSGQVEILDRQHKHIHQMLESMHAAIVEGAGTHNIKEAAQALVLATTLHFTTEEEVIERIAPSLLKRHRLLHNELAAMIRRIGDSLASGDMRAALDLISFFTGQIRHHMEVEDAKFEDMLSCMVTMVAECPEPAITPTTLPLY
jgi:hemerythrin-like metal-binding protein